MAASIEPITGQRLEDLVRRLRAFDAAMLHEAFGQRGALPPFIKPVDASMVCCGPAFTVACVPGDNLMLQVAISHAPPGSVVVAATTGWAHSAVVGDMLSVAAQARGLAGIVTDGAARDTRSIRELGFPVFSNGVSIQGPVKQATGPLNRPVRLGGQTVNPGDLVFGDEDGVVVIPPGDVERVLAGAAARTAQERDKVAAFRQGRTLIDVNGLAPFLEEKGWSATKEIGS